MRMSRRTASIATVAAGLVALAAAVAPSALADGHGTGSGIDKQRMMRKSDVPAVLGKTTSYGFTNRSLDRSLGICEDANGKVTSIVAPTRQAWVTIENKATKAAPYSSEDEFVYQYDSTDAATAAFKALATAAAACTGATSGKDPGSTQITLTTTLSTGTVPVGAAGAATWVQESTAYTAPAGFPANGAKTVSYTVFAQAGDAITSTVYYVNGSDGISPAQVTATQQLAQGNAMRWMARR